MSSGIQKSTTDQAYANNKGANQAARPRSLISAIFVN